MGTYKTTASEAKIALTFTTTERKLLTRDLQALRDRFFSIFEQTPADQPIELSFAEFQLLLGYLSLEEERASNARIAGRLRRLSDKLTQILSSAETAHPPRSIDRTAAPRRPAQAGGKSPVAEIPVLQRLYQLRISLTDVAPTIWRRIQVKDCTLEALHAHIQTAMGWHNCHLYEFLVRGLRFSDPCYELGEFEPHVHDATRIRLSDIVPRDGRRFRFGYTYDFGDDWQHDVLFEGWLRESNGACYPLCVEGERACPPENVGGIWGFEEYLEAISDPLHEHHEEMVLWNGPYDPDGFDAEAATRKMQRGLSYWP